MTKLSQTYRFTPPAASPLCPLNRSARILVLDKSEVLRGICVELLAERGYEVDAAADGQAGWEALLARPYDLLITEHDLPRLNGLELIKKVCASSLTLPIIIASGSLSSGELRRHPAIQIAAALPKPFSPREFVQTVQEVLGDESRLSLTHHQDLLSA